MNIINCIINNGILINMFSSLVIAIATVFYVILTIKLVSENIKNRRIQIDPKIMLDIIPDSTHPFLLNFFLENIGNGIALNIRFTIICEPEFKKSKKLSEYGFIKNGLK